MTPLFSVLYVVGITAESMTAALSAGRQKLDLFGVTMIASMTALGGGTVRDLLIGAVVTLLAYLAFSRLLGVNIGAGVLEGIL